MRSCAQSFALETGLGQDRDAGRQTRAAPSVTESQQWLIRLDIETTGLEPESSKIITIQYQQLDRNSGVPKGPLVILREWELGEAEIIKRFIENTPAASGRDFDFVPVGYNLKFEHKFLRHRAERYGLPAIDILGRPMLDLQRVKHRHVVRPKGLRQDRQIRRGRGSRILKVLCVAVQGASHTPQKVHGKHSLGRVQDAQDAGGRAGGHSAV